MELAPDCPARYSLFLIIIIAVDMERVSMTLDKIAIRLSACHLINDV